MQPVSLLSDLETVDQAFVDAVAAVAGLSNILVLDTFWGSDRETGVWPEGIDRREADVYIEWKRFKGRYGLAVDMYGPKPLREPISEAVFVRRLAMTLGRRLVTSDCDPNPWSYYRIDPNGSLHHDYMRTDDENGDEVFDLVSELDPGDPDFIASLEIWPASAPWPAKPADAPDHMPPEIRRLCRAAPGDEGKLCETFWASCPKQGLKRW